MPFLKSPWRSKGTGIAKPWVSWKDSTYIGAAANWLYNNPGKGTSAGLATAAAVRGNYGQAAYHAYRYYTTPTYRKPRRRYAYRKIYPSRRYLYHAYKRQQSRYYRRKRVPYWIWRRRHNRRRRLRGRYTT